jgi:hypothetical protein
MQGNLVMIAMQTPMMAAAQRVLSKQDIHAPVRQAHASATAAMARSMLGSSVMMVAQRRSALQIVDLPRKSVETVWCRMANNVTMAIKMNLMLAPTRV